MRLLTFESDPWNSRTSSLARGACVVYALLLAYSGLAPWSGWRNLGLNPFAYLTAPIPAHVTSFDLAFNVLAYLPFGALVVLALHPAARGMKAVLIAGLIGFLVAASVEAAQSFLPSRISSNLDLLTNSGGALIGALIAAPLASSLIDRGRLAEWRLRWFERDASVLLLVIALWPVAQIYPEPMLFGNGAIRDAMSPFSSEFGDALATIDAAVFGAAKAFGVAEFVLAEAFVVAAAMLAAGLAFASTMRRRAPRVKLLLALLVAAWLVKTLAHAVEFGPERALSWLTPGAYGGIALGALSLLAASAGPRVWSARLSLLATLALIIAVNLVPENPFYIDAIRTWQQGALVHFNLLTRWLSLLWPYVLAIVLLFAAARGRNAATSL